MLRSVVFMLAVTFTVFGEAVEKNSDRIIIGDAQHRVPPLEAMETSKIDPDKVKAGKEPAQLEGVIPEDADVGIPPMLDEETIKMLEKRKSTKNKKQNRKKGSRFQNSFERHGEARRSHRRKRTKPRWVPEGLHNFDITTAHGTTLRLSNGAFPDAKVFLIVNTASESEFSPQYAELETLWNEWRHQGLQIIAFPSNSFNQEPLSDNEIQKFVRETYGVTYPVMAKCDVTGKERIDLYKWLTKNTNRDGKVPEWAPLEESGLKNSDVQWNFEKFLVYNRREGQVIIRFDYDYAPKELEQFIERGILVHDKLKVELR